MTGRKPRFFNTPERLREMFALRESGLSYLAIARIYDVDHTTIVYHCIKHDIYPHGQDKYTLRRERYRKAQQRILIKRAEKLQIARLKHAQEEATRHIKTKSKYAHILFEPVNTGKTYKQYLKDAGIKFKLMNPYLDFRKKSPKGLRTWEDLEQNT